MPALKLAAALALLSACAQNSDPVALPGTFTNVYTTLFPRATKYQCEMCHGLPANDISNGLLAMGMDQATAYAALVGQQSASSKCGGMDLVVAGDAEHSLMYLKLSPNPPCGDRMPLSGKTLSAAQLTMVRAWIDDGAADD
ncbi:hypothetical protein BH11MYX2_BH11MYX2_27060 [soil metagenome]